MKFAIVLEMVEHLKYREKMLSTGKCEKMLSTGTDCSTRGLQILEIRSSKASIFLTREQSLAGRVGVLFCGPSFPANN